MDSLIAQEKAQKESRAVTYVEELCDIPRIVAVDPLGIEIGVSPGRQKGLGDPSVQQARVNISDAENFAAFRSENWQQVDSPFPPGQRVPAFARCRKRR